MHESWRVRLVNETAKPYFKQLVEFVQQERREHVVFPPRPQVFTAFKVTPFEGVRVVILGQDPYHNAGQAHGLSFSVLPGVKPPPSLQNIYKELEADLGFKTPTHGHLMAWAEQGVFLLNSVLTVRAHTPGSHRGKGWETFTNAVIELLSARSEPMVFILWGSYARGKAGLIQGHHTVLESAHPSPMSAHNGFFGSRPFSKTNAALQASGVAPINWQL